MLCWGFRLWGCSVWRNSIFSAARLMLLFIGLLWFFFMSSLHIFVLTAFPMTFFSYIPHAYIFLPYVNFTCFRKVAKTTILEQDPLNHKINGSLCLRSPSSTSKDGVFIAEPPLYPAVKNDIEIQTTLFLFI